MEEVKAIVQKVIKESKHGSFAVATSEEIDGSVTFSLEPTVWQETEKPEEGTVVILSDLRRKRAGWRAKTGRFFKLSDEQRERSNEMEGKKGYEIFTVKILTILSETGGLLRMGEPSDVKLAQAFKQTCQEIGEDPTTEKLENIAKNFVSKFYRVGSLHEDWFAAYQGWSNQNPNELEKKCGEEAKRVFPELEEVGKRLYKSHSALGGGIAHAVEQLSRRDRSYETMAHEMIALMQEVTEPEENIELLLKDGKERMLQLLKSKEAQERDRILAAIVDAITADPEFPKRYLAYEILEESVDEGCIGAMEKMAEAPATLRFLGPMYKSGVDIAILVEKIRTLIAQQCEDNYFPYFLKNCVESAMRFDRPQSRNRAWDLLSRVFS